MTPTRSLPSSAESLLVRTYFDDPYGWGLVASAAVGESPDGFRAWVRVVDDPAWAGATPEEVRAAALAAGDHAEVLFVVDQLACTG